MFPYSQSTYKSAKNSKLCKKQKIINVVTRTLACDAHRKECENHKNYFIQIAHITFMTKHNKPELIIFLKLLLIIALKPSILHRSYKSSREDEVFIKKELNWKKIIILVTQRDRCVYKDIHAKNLYR